MQIYAFPYPLRLDARIAGLTAPVQKLIVHSQRPTTAFTMAFSVSTRAIRFFLFCFNVIFLVSSDTSLLLITLLKVCAAACLVLGSIILSSDVYQRDVIVTALTSVTVSCSLGGVILA